MSVRPPDAVLQLAEQLRERISRDSLDVSFVRSSGPGGQNVNKVSTKVILTFDVNSAGDLTDDERRTIFRRLAGRISAEGQLRVACSRFRTQSANRDAAVDRFYELLAAALVARRKRRKTVTPRSAIERRLRNKRSLADRKRERRARPDE